jgi:hypothetical protein
MLIGTCQDLTNMIIEKERVAQIFPFWLPRISNEESSVTVLFREKKVKSEEADVLLLHVLALLLPSLATSYSNIFQVKD